MQHIMKKLLQTIFLLFITQISFGQNLMEIALKDKPLIIESEAFEIKQKLKLMDFRDVNEQCNKIDKTLLEDLKLQSEKEQKSVWEKSDFKNRLVINPNEKINLDSVKTIVNALDKSQRKLLIKEIKKYNANEMFYRNFPLEVSKPIYSSDEKFAVIGFSRGNNGGEIVLYKLVGEKWEVECGLIRWAY